MNSSEKSHEYELMERLSQAYGEAGYTSQTQALEDAKSVGFTDVTQTLLSDWMVAVRDRAYSRTVKPENRRILEGLVSFFEMRAREIEAGAPPTARRLVREIREKLDELERTLPKVTQAEIEALKRKTEERRESERRLREEAERPR